MKEYPSKQRRRGHMRPTATYYDRKRAADGWTVEATVWTVVGMFALLIWVAL